MATRKPKTLIVSRDCESISAHNFFKLKTSGDIRWMYPGFDGYSRIKSKLPKKTEDYKNDIFAEYSDLTKNNSSLDYMETVADAEDSATRITGVSLILDAINKRWFIMSDEIKNEYIEVLKNWNFYLNESKPIDKEIDRMYRQLRAARTKFNILKQKVKDSEKSLDSRGFDIIKLKVKVQNILKRHIDLKEISIKEWYYTVEEIPKKST